MSVTQGLPWPAYAGFLAIVAVASARFLLKRPYDRSALPPGPEPRFLTGNKIPRPYSWRYFETLTQRYGDVFTIWLGRKPLVVVGTYKAANEIMVSLKCNPLGWPNAENRF